MQRGRAATWRSEPLAPAHKRPNARPRDGARRGVVSRHDNAWPAIPPPTMPRRSMRSWPPHSLADPWFDGCGCGRGASLRSAVSAIGATRCIVQPMVPAALGAIAGVTRSPGVGLVLLAGLGGIYTEALHQSCVWPIPIGREAIEQSVENSGLGRVLCSARWQYPGTMGAFVDLLCALQRAAIALGDQLQAIDVNPVILGEQGAIAVDALVVPRR